jgi:septum formation protein
MKFILASGSPRRRELLRQIGIEPQIMVSDYAEDNCNLDPAGLVIENALGKGLRVLLNCSRDDVVIAADTVVLLDNTILGKPKDPLDAFNMLKNLSGRTHEVLTGVAVFYRGKKKVAVERTIVEFRTLTDKEIQTYVATGEPADKAGAYGIQGLGAVFINSIAGCYSNVVGLPLARLYTLFAELDVTLYDEPPHQGITTGRST